MDANDFHLLHQCFNKQTFDNLVVKKFVHDWLPQKVRYLANQEAMGEKLGNNDYEEIGQNVSELILEKIEEIIPGIPFRSWVCKAIIFETKNYVRRKKKEIPIDLTEDQNRVAIQIEKNRRKPTVEDFQKIKLYEGINSLPPLLYSSFVSKYIHEKSSKEIAEELGITVDKVDQRNYRARKKLESKLAKYFPQYIN